MTIHDHILIHGNYWYLSMETHLAKYIPAGYTDDHTHPLIVQGLTGLDMIDIMKAAQLTPSVPDSVDYHDDSNNDHVDLINAHIMYFQETGFYQKRIWYFIIYPYLINCVLSYMSRKTKQL